MAFELTSPEFDNNEKIPRRFTADGENISPPLRWQDVPAGTREFALVCEDPDAPQDEPVVHWLAYKIPSQAQELPEALPDGTTLKRPLSLLQGKNSFRKTRFNGPVPPKKGGPHRYFFKLYALDAELPVKPGAGREQLWAAMQGHVLAEADLVGIYERN